MDISELLNQFFAAAAAAASGAAAWIAWVSRGVIQAAKNTDIQDLQNEVQELQQTTYGSGKNGTDHGMSGQVARIAHDCDKIKQDVSEIKHALEKEKDVT